MCGMDLDYIVSYLSGACGGCCEVVFDLLDAGFVEGCGYGYFGGDGIEGDGAGGEGLPTAGMTGMDGSAAFPGFCCAGFAAGMRQLNADESVLTVYEIDYLF